MRLLAHWNLDSGKRLPAVATHSLPLSYRAELARIRYPPIAATTLTAQPYVAIACLACVFGQCF